MFTIGRETGIVSGSIMIDILQSGDVHADWEGGAQLPTEMETELSLQWADATGKGCNTLPHVAMTRVDGD